MAKESKVTISAEVTDEDRDYVLFVGRGKISDGIRLLIRQARQNDPLLKITPEEALEGLKSNLHTLVHNLAVDE